MAPALKANCSIKPPCFLNIVVVLYNSVETNSILKSTQYIFELPSLLICQATTMK